VPALRPFRFGVQLHSLDPARWAEQVQRIEALGYSTVFWPDHFSPQWDPTTALAAAAAVTGRLRVGSLVYDVDYRHPVIHAKAAATLQILSGGRHEFGIGAGWMESDYLEAGLPYDRAGIRIRRLGEALKIIEGMWRDERTSFEGEFYTVRNIARAAPLPAGGAPRILIGGGGPRLLALAGRHADIVGINPVIPEGRVTPETIRDLSPERVREKVRWVRESAQAAGRDADAIELQSLVFAVAITDDARGIREAFAKQAGLTPEQVTESALTLLGSASEVRERLLKRREETGISYVVIQGGDLATVEGFAEAVVDPLGGR
jgi:probable F420-dependent oxidoreductase